MHTFFSSPERASLRVALIAPSGAVDEERYALTLQRLGQLGATVVSGQHVLDRHRYLAGTAEQRVNDLHEAFERDDADVVWCLRGGYGADHLLPLIDWTRIARHSERALVGYSDVTVLLEAFYRHGLPAIHAPVATELALVSPWPPEETDARWQSMRSLQHVHAHTDGHMETVRFAGPDMTVSGQLRGGNLVTLASLCGTPGAMVLERPTLLMLEEVGEADYRIERCFHQLLSSLDTRWLSGVCLGSFTRQGDATTSSHAALAEWLAPLNIPLHHQLPFGHYPVNHAWPYGAMATLSTEGLHWHVSTEDFR